MTLVLKSSLILNWYGKSDNEQLGKMTMLSVLWNDVYDGFLSDNFFGTGLARALGQACFARSKNSR